MYVLKTPAFLRSSSRPTSPAPPASPLPHKDAAPAGDRSRAILANFKRSASPLTRPPTSIVHDGSYMEVLSLRLSEAISRALAQPSGQGKPSELLNGRRPIPAGRGRELGNLIATEVKASREDPHLYRAVIRTLHRPFSVLVTNISGSLLPLIASPAFAVVPSPQQPAPNSTQLHAVGFATFAGELLETFDELRLGQDSDTRGDGLKGVRDSLVSTIKRVVEPLVAGIKKDLMPHLEELEQATAIHTKVPGTTKVVPMHPSIMHLQSAMPMYARALELYITSSVAEGLLASLTISLVWRGLIALSNRIAPALHSPPGSPSMPPKATKDHKRRGSSSTPPTTPPPSRFTLKLPPSRPPSPINGNKTSTAAGDAKALHDILSMVPRPTNDLPREVVCDAFDSLSALVALLEYVQNRRPADGAVQETVAELETLNADLPVLIALPVLLRSYVFPAAPECTVSHMLGLTEESYRAGCLGGFGRAEECTIAVGQRVLSVLEVTNAPEAGKEVVTRWLAHEVQEAISEQQT